MPRCGDYLPRELSADGLRAVVANSGDDSVSIVDVAAKRELYRVPVGAIPYGVDLTDNDQTAAVTLWGANKVVLVELGASAGKVVKSFDVGSLPYTVVVPSGGVYAVVSCFGSHQVYVVDLKRSQVLAPVPVGRSPWGLSASIDGKSVIVANFYSGDASILAITSQGVEELKRVALARVDGQGKTAGARRAKNATFTGDPNVAVITDLGTNEVLIFDVAAQKVLRTIAVGRAPYGVAFVPRPTSTETTPATGR